MVVSVLLQQETPILGCAWGHFILWGQFTPFKISIYFFYVKFWSILPEKYLTSVPGISTLVILLMTATCPEQVHELSRTIKLCVCKYFAWLKMIKHGLGSSLALLLPAISHVSLAPAHLFRFLKMKYKWFTYEHPFPTMLDTTQVAQGLEKIVVCFLCHLFPPSASLIIPVISSGISIFFSFIFLYVTCQFHQSLSFPAAQSHFFNLRLIFRCFSRLQKIVWIVGSQELMAIAGSLVFPSLSPLSNICITTGLQTHSCNCFRVSW